jgi:hypothetical protein
MVLKRTMIVATALILATNLSMAIDPLPKKKGLNGFVNLGAGAMWTKSNTLAGNVITNVGSETIENITDAPRNTDTNAVPAANWLVGYYWDTSRTFLFFGNQLEDLIRYDFTGRFGLNKGVGEEGVLSFEIVQNIIPAEVWEDPYLTGVPREETDRTSTGLRLTWDRIGGSDLEIAVAGRDVDVDDERSGQSQPITPAERQLLDRNGDLRVVEVLYRFGRGSKHRVYPAIRFTDYDLDGAAMANDQVRGQLTYGYKGKRTLLTGNLIVGSSDFDAVNPLYGVTREDDLLGLTVTTFFGGLFGSENWNGVINAAYFERDSNIDFYDSEAAVLTFSALRRF